MTPLPAISALVRAGAVERAAELFLAGGYGERTQDPAAQAVRGRLLKARGRLADGSERRRLFAEAAAAYAAAHALAPAPYLAINAATLHFLAGERTLAEAGARSVLALLDAAEPPTDTPYFLAATRAEALLLLGDDAGAEQAMDAAATCDPDGWSDRAVTLAQLAEILDARGDPDSWLDRFRPPASLHFAGHMAVTAGGTSEKRLAAEIDSLIARHTIGFAWGALAAGADIIIAERLLGAGAELHVILPCAPDRFEAQSVAPAGTAWQARFRGVLAKAASLRLAAADARAVHDPLATAHAGELAIGGALLNARALQAPCCQLIVCDEDGGGPNTARQAAMWPDGSGPQHRLTLPRDTAIEALFPPESVDVTRRLAVHLAIRIDRLSRPAGIDPAEAAQVARTAAQALAEVDRSRVRAAPGRWDVVLDDPARALAVMLDLADQCRTAGLPQPSQGAHIAVADLIDDPASGTAIPYGPGLEAANRLCAMAPPGLALISDALAVTMAARGATGLRSELYSPGDEGTDGAAHVLLRAH
jgi:tetratricopeptide (TPR) repeat protein